MWTRAELKERAKTAFMKNYWVCVAAAFILSLLVGGSSGGSSSGSSIDLSEDSSIMSMFEDDSDDIFEDDYEWEDDYDDSYSVENDDEAMAIFGIVGIVVIVIVLIVVVIAAVFGIFVSNVIEVGGCSFFTKNATNDNVSLKELFSGFMNGNYMKNVSVQFFRGLYTFLWSLLFVIPGIVKSYEYMMIPYILADNPNISREDAFALSKRMMDGHKWDTFVLGLSFIGWGFVAAISCGMAGIFYVEPYMQATYAELYLKLKSNVMPSQPVDYYANPWDNAQVY